MARPLTVALALVGGAGLPASTLTEVEKVARERSDPRPGGLTNNQEKSTHEDDESDGRPAVPAGGLQR
jgi:hypothetical protein